MPQSHKGTKFHKDLDINIVLLVNLCALVPLWQKKTYRSRLNNQLFK
jgi:hypothetical protein